MLTVAAEAVLVEERLSGQRVEELFDRHHRRLYRLARRLSSDPEDAHDLVQDTFLRAARAPSSIPDGESGGEAWLVTTLVNLCRDRGRRLRTRTSSFQAPSPLVVADHGAAVVTRATLEAALARLAPRRRAVVVMHELEGLDSAEVGRLLGIRRVTVRWHLAAGRHELRRILVERGRRRTRTRADEECGDRTRTEDEAGDRER